METTGGYFYRPAGNSSSFVAIEFLSQITNTRKLIRNVRTYMYIHILEKWFPLQGERAQSLKVFNVCMLCLKKKKKNEKEETEQQQTYQFTTR